MRQNSTTVSLELDSRPENVTLVRGMLAGVAELLLFDAEQLDDIKTAVSEACNNVVVHAYGDGRGPLRVNLAVTAGNVEVIVRDRGSGIQQVVSSEDRMGVGLAVISALADRAEFLSSPEGGTEVRMAFTREGAGLQAHEPTVESELGDQRPALVSGDVVVTLSPASLLAAVLGRLARALAAGARFSLDRFSDVYLVTDAIAAHAEGAASGNRISFALEADEKRLGLTLGPLRAGSGARLRGDATPDQRRSPLAVLVDELAVQRNGDVETLRVVMCDRSRDSSSAAD